MNVEIVTIGDELLLGFTVDTNAAHLARELAAIGITVARRGTVGDDAAVIRDAIGDALDRAGAVITTGGLGPTSDDVTKPAVAELFGRAMVLDAEHLEWMRERWRRRFGREMPESNVRQALLPHGARKLENRHGSAPGIWLEDDRGRWVAMLPGVPREMRGMLADTLLPILRDRVGESHPVRSRTLRTTGVAESLLAEWIEQRTIDLQGATLAYLPSVAGVDLRLTLRDRPAAVADRVLSEVGDALRAAASQHVYGEGSADLAAEVLERCRARGLTLAVAESCTGGLAGARLTAVPGSSDVVLGGIIAYHNDVKSSLLGVTPETLGSEGAVSEATVRAMASGVRKRVGADIGLAITGIAGPGGGTEEKPVGTVWISVALADVVEVRLLRLWGDREEIRQRAVQAVLDLARRRLDAPFDGHRVA
jgi:nicotinamide-nucleotide amidase